MSDVDTPRKSPAERRRFRRVRLDLPGRLFIPAIGEEAACQIGDLSPGGANVACVLTPATGTQVVLYVDGFGRFEGEVVRRDGRAFGVRFSCTLLKRERIAEQLTLFLNNALVEGAMLRRERGNHKEFAKFTRADGQIVQCEIMDISAGSVSLRTDVRPGLGEFVLIAQMAGRVSRHHDKGIDIEFVGTQAGAEAPPKLNLVR
ncbi:MAG TPA: PilZ domain-containing protein [Rhizomicrobium sp.]|nr:PilZ domain-containing protein [Rhizomicrobium sp.]